MIAEMDILAPFEEALEEAAAAAEADDVEKSVVVDGEGAV